MRFTSERRHGVLECSQWLPVARPTVFAFFAEAHNLERITPPFLRFRIVDMSTPRIEHGTRIRYRLRLHGLPFAWTSCIDVWEPPDRFADTQLRGPYAHWYHLHTFDTEGDGTRLGDHVTFRLPFAFLHRTPVLEWVARDVQRIFAFRQRVIEELLVPTTRS